MSIEAIKLALDALDWHTQGKAHIPLRSQKAITALRQAIEQAEKQEPVAWCVYLPSQQCAEYFDDKNDVWMCDMLTNNDDAEVTPLYTAPPQREWVGLTDEEITTIVREAAKGSAIRRDGSTSHRIARAIEAKLKEKNT